MKTTQHTLLDAILDADYELALSIVDTAVNTFGYETTLHEIIDSVLHSVGVKWGTGEVSLAQGFVAGKVVERFLTEFDAYVGNTQEKKGTIILGNIEDDFHLLGRKLVGIFLKSNGWNVIDLGNDIPADEFVDAAIENNSHVIAASAMMYSTAQNMKMIREELIKRHLESSIKIALGGAIFQIRPELLEKLGGDGTASDAVSAVALIEKLHNEAVQGGSNA